MAAPNSYRCFVRDSLGQTFLWTCGTNRPELVEGSKRHAREWLRWRRRPAAGRDKLRDGRPYPSPIGNVEIVVEFYQDATAP